MGVFVGAFGVAASLTCVYLAMRNLMVTSGGSCASGGPYEIRGNAQCSSGQTLLLAGGIVGGMIFAAILATCSEMSGGSALGVGLLSWAATFGVLGFNFLSLGLNPPDLVDSALGNGEIGWIVCGVIFELMALGGLIPALLLLKGWFKRGGTPDQPLFRGPLVRAKVLDDLGAERSNAFGPLRIPGQPVDADAASPPNTLDKPAVPIPKRLVIPPKDPDQLG